MSIIGQNILAGASAAGEAYTIDQSCKFVLGSSTYMDRTMGTGSRTTWTYSVWVKKVMQEDAPCLFSAYRLSNAIDSIVVKDDGTTFEVSLGTVKGKLKTSGHVRDVAAWSHWVCVWDTTNGTAADRMRLYLNGERISLQTDTQPIEDEVSNIGLGSSVVMNIGQQGDTSQFGDMYMAEAIYIDGTAYDVSEFGETNATTNQWVPKDPSLLTFGGQGHWLKFQNSAALGDDSSGNNNDFAANGFAAAVNQVPDSPTNNFCTLDSNWAPLYNSGLAYNESALVFDSTGDAAVVGTFALSSGKWYWEAVAQTLNAASCAYGVISFDTTSSADWTGKYTIINSNTPSNYIMEDGSITQAGVTGFTTGDVIGIAFNLDDNEIDFYVNNVKSGVTASLNSIVSLWLPFCMNGPYTSTKKIIFNFGQDSAFVGQKTAQNNQDENDIGDFYYTPPAGFLTLCTSNMAIPSIKKSDSHFNAVLYTGDGAASHPITGVGFKPDLLWIKDKAVMYHRLVDNVRGPTKYLATNVTNAEITDATQVVSLDSDGFTVGTAVETNTNTNTYVSWNWKGDGVAGGTLNEVGSEDTQVNANTTAGVSIVTYTGNRSYGNSRPWTFSSTYISDY